VPAAGTLNPLITKAVKPRGHSGNGAGPVAFCPSKILLAKSGGTVDDSIETHAMLRRFLIVRREPVRKNSGANMLSANGPDLFAQFGTINSTRKKEATGR
jgi:hypothetical protein